MKKGLAIEALGVGEVADARTAYGPADLQEVGQAVHEERETSGDDGWATGTPIGPEVQPERVGEVECSTSCTGYIAEKIWDTDARKQKSRTFVGCSFCFLWAFMWDKSQKIS